MSYTLILKDCQYFKKKVFFWKSLLGVGEWRVHVEFGGADKGNQATVYMNKPGKVATIFLNKKWNSQPNKSDLSKCALHEVIEVCFNDIGNMLSENYNNSYISKKIHEVIRKLENLAPYVKGFE